MKTLDRSGLGRAWLTIGAMRHRTLWRCTAIFIAGHLLFLVGLTAPDEPYFDEVYYVAAARQLLAHGPPQNPEHPPLVKELIAASMAVWGDNPFGWRYMSALFGAAALAGVYALAVLFFDSRSARAVDDGANLRQPNALRPVARGDARCVHGRLHDLGDGRGHRELAVAKETKDQTDSTSSLNTKANLSDEA